MNRLRAITLVFAMLVTSSSVHAGDGVLMPGSDKTPPPPPPPVSAPQTADTTAGEAGETGESLLLWYAGAIWLQLHGISIQL